MANIEIKDGEYTKTIYSMIKEQRYDHFRLGTTVSKKKSKVLYPKSFHFLVDTISKNHFFHIYYYRYNEAINVLSYIYDLNPSSRAALSLLAYCYYYTQVRFHFVLKEFKSPFYWNMEIWVS